MTKMALLALTPAGIQLAQKIRDKWEKSMPIFVPAGKQADNLAGFPGDSFKHGIQQLFKEYDALICIMATGIVVRGIAEVLEDKRKDPAVIVIDEKGKNVISLLSGHIGGGNQLTIELVEMLGSHPVITTATDVQEVTAIDVLTKELDGWYADFKENTKWINGLLADHQKVGLIQQEEWVKDQRGLILIQEDDSFDSFEAVLLISDQFEEKLSEKVLQIVPRRYVLGIGARKKIPFTVVQEEFLSFCQQENLHPRSIKKIVSIDLKKEEHGICQLAEWLTVPFETYSAAELAEAAKKYPQSEFVQQTIGIGNVSLAAADVASRGQVITERYANNGVTFALGKDEK